MTAATPLTLILAGEVDHGKSTLIGRLLHDTHSLTDGKIEELQAASARRGVAFEWSFALDALQAERDQAITIDTTRFWLHLPKRDVVIVDAPGHREFLLKMVAGATVADAAILVVDAGMELQQQTKIHLRMLRLIGIEQILVAVTKMDCVDFAEAPFRARHAEIVMLFAQAGVLPCGIVPVAARDGDNLVRPSSRMDWHRGPPLTAMLEALVPRSPPVEKPLRLPIQDVYRFDQRRILAGRIESGRLAVGDELLFSPSNITARIHRIEQWPTSSKSEAIAGQSIGLILDRPIFVERGEVASHTRKAPLLSRHFGATLAWLSAAPLEHGRTYRLQLGTTEATVTVDADEQAMGDAIGHAEIADVTLRSAQLLSLDETRPLVLRDGTAVVACGFLRLAGVADERQAKSPGTNLVPTDHRVTRARRAQRFGHKGGVIWLTGLSGSGKSTLAMALEEILFRKGYAVYVIDGDNLRSGLNHDLGFSPSEREENIRRAGEVAALFADAGFIAIAAFISPYAADRARARKACGDAFHEVYVDADLATCEARDVKGLYRRARAGEVAAFTGISAPYEIPPAPELTLDTARWPVDACLEQLYRYVAGHLAVDQGRSAQRQQAR